MGGWNKMEVEEAQKRKQTLEHKIVTLLNDFTEETGLYIDYIELIDMLRIKGEQKRVASLVVGVSI